LSPACLLDSSELTLSCRFNVRSFIPWLMGLECEAHVLRS
jgi:hypothetical protein